jgi:hypothetical protein
VRDSQNTDPTRELEAEAESRREAWGAWLRTLSTFAAETDPVRARELAAEVAGGMPFAMQSRLAFLELLPLEIRRRELEATPAARFAAALKLAGQIGLSDGVVPDYVREKVAPTEGG